MSKIFATVKGRIWEYIESHNINKEFFFEKTGINRSNFSGKSAQSELGGEMIVKILNEFPQISADWLLRGEGSPERKKESPRLDESGAVDRVVLSLETYNSMILELCSLRNAVSTSVSN